MTSARVDIVWGTPCEMSAAFEFENESSAPVELELGFPIISFMDRAGISQRRTSFSVAFEGVPVAAREATRTKSIEDDATRTLFH